MMEQWKNTNNTCPQMKTIIAVSNYGRLKLRSGEIKDSYYRQVMRYEGKSTKVHIVIAKLFIPKTDEDIRLGRNCIDHKTHNPIGININDIRNLRWCTYKENSNFPEARANKHIPHKVSTQGKYERTPEILNKCRQSHLGKIPWNKGLTGTEYVSHYPNGIKNCNRAKEG